ncbi:hypothetical protein AJ79_05967 [Helicocarpus griseus UAMH5409]|uniref:Cupin type-1 domain-containing protein n=1 Tax=Helicocarpus griseus UAMH5409 TaxID=1447875 RepID=A0A2B7XIN4_9EURO|nr:hypothetical protein AJ79_05967 [Helicocarpus griseus UAMH5409]
MSTLEEPVYDRSRPLPTLQPIYHHLLANSPGKSIIGVLVKFPPNASSPPHRHGGASVSVYVMQGTVYNKMNNDPMRVIEQGEPAVLLATFVIATEAVEKGGYAALIQVDEEYGDVVFPEPEGELI